MRYIKVTVTIIVFAIILFFVGSYLYKGIVIAPADETLQNIPDLDRIIIKDNSLSQEASVILKDKIKVLSDELKLDPDNFSSWLDLGIWRKAGGDYDGARAAWIYASKIRPQNSTSFNNLGDLYAYYLNEPRKAEENFLKAIENGPNEIYLYFKLYDFYNDIMKDNAKARAVVEKGLESNPNSKELQDLLDSI